MREGTGRLGGGRYRAWWDETKIVQERPKRHSDAKKCVMYIYTQLQHCSVTCAHVNMYSC